MNNMRLEDDCRRMAARRGFFLVKINLRDHPETGGYSILDISTNSIAAGSAIGLTLKQVKEYLERTDLPGKRSGAAAQGSRQGL